jgi:hypothetical protein
MHFALALREQSRDFAAGDEAHHIDIVGSKIQDYTYVSNPRRKRSEPTSRDLKDAAEVACLHSTSQLDYGWIEALDMADHENPLGPLRACDHRLSLAHIRCYRLLHQDMRSGEERDLDNLTVLSRWDRDADHVWMLIS